jgi:hypothetical protein
MNVKNDILEELRSVSELVTTISRETPYRVADDYFTDFSNRVMLRIQTQHKPLAFNVPDGYFEGFAEGVLARIKSGVGARPEFEPMKATAGGASEMEQELSALSPLLAQLRSKETYRMPEGYFEEISPVLTVANRLNPYTVPSAYFQELPAEINQKISEPGEEKKAAKVVALGAGRTRRLWRYSAAAVVAGLILTIGWLRLQQGGAHPVKPADNMTASLTRVSDQDLQSFLSDQDTTLAQPVSVVAMQDFNDNDLKSLLGDVPDGELKQYMEEHGGANDIATN